jgi:hypothetical protein
MISFDMYPHWLPLGTIGTPRLPMDWAAASQSFYSIQLAELAIECAQRNVSSLPRNLENHAIRETYLGPFSVVRKCGPHDIRILKNKTLVIEKHVDCERNPWFFEFEDRVENPYRLDQHQM